MKIASFNVQNMSRRAVVLNQGSDHDATTILEAFAAVTEPLGQETYSAWVQVEL